MRISLYSLFIGIAAFGCSISLHCMDVDPRSPQKDTVLFNPNIQPTVITELAAALNADEAHVNVDAFILTDSTIIDLLIDIHTKHPGNVSVHMHKSNANNKTPIQKLESAGITVIKSAQHTKRLSIQYKQADETVWHRRTIAGSYNLSKSAQRNKEMMVIEYNDSPAHNAHVKSHQQGTKRTKKHELETLDATPAKKTIIDNAEHDLHASLAPRIANTNTGDSIYFASMNYGHAGLHAALVEAAKRKVLVHMLLDTDATSQENIPLLDELTHHGAHIVLPTGQFKVKEGKTLLEKLGIFHQKYLVRVRAGKILTCVSTANATKHAEHDFNVSTYYPNQTDMGNAIIAEHTKLALQGVTYQDFKNSGAQLPKRKSSKKKIALSGNNE